MNIIHALPSKTYNHILWHAMNNSILLSSVDMATGMILFKLVVYKLYILSWILTLQMPQISLTRTNVWCYLTPKFFHDYLDLFIKCFVTFWTLFNIHLLHVLAADNQTTLSTDCAVTYTGVKWHLLAILGTALAKYMYMFLCNTIMFENKYVANQTRDKFKKSQGI